MKFASELLQIEPLLKRRPAQLSGGQRQRVAIGRALVRDVDVFLFDEPLSNLDAKLRTELRVELKRLHQRLGKATMIYVTHDQIEALTLADRIAVMHAGVIQQLDTPHNIYHRPANRFVAGFVGSPTMNFRTGRIAESGGPVFESEGIRIPLSDYPWINGSPTGQEVELGVRPEHIAIHGDLQEPARGGGGAGRADGRRDDRLVPPCRSAARRSASKAKARSRPARACRSASRPSGSISSTPRPVCVSSQE